MANKMFKSKVFVFVVVISMALLLFPREALSQPSPGTLTGFIYYENIKNPMEKAVVKIKNVVTGQEYQSPQTEKKGEYSLARLEPGRYVIGVSTPAGDFNFTQEVIIKPNEVAKLSLVLKPGRAPVAILAPAAGKSFFATPLGIAIAAVGAAGATAGIVTLTSPATPALSPSSR